MSDERFLLWTSGAPFAISGCRAPYFDKNRCPELQGLYEPDPYERKAMPDDTALPEDREPHPEMTPEDARVWLRLTKRRAKRKQIEAAWKSVLKEVASISGVENSYRDYLARQINEARIVLLRQLGA
jgi:hypothetical protein